MRSNGEVIARQANVVPRLPRKGFMVEVISRFDVEVTVVQVVAHFVTAKVAGKLMIKQLGRNARAASRQVVCVTKVVRARPAFTVEQLTKIAAHADHAALEFNCITGIGHAEVNLPHPVQACDID